MVDTSFWVDSYIQELDPSEKLIYLYLLTNQHTKICGIYEISLKQIAFDTGFEKEMISKIIIRFEKDNKVLYRNGWIALKNWIKHQSMTGNVLKGIEDGFSLSPIELVEWVKGEIRPLKTLQDPLRPSQYPNPNPNPNLYIHDKKLENENENEIETLYKLYPSKCPIANRSTGKSTKDKQTIKRLLSTVEYSVLRETIELYLKSCLDSRCYVKNFKTFLNNLPDLDSLRSTETKKPAPAGPSISEIEFQEKRRQEFLDSLKGNL